MWVLGVALGLSLSGQGLDPNWIAGPLPQQASCLSTAVELRLVDLDTFWPMSRQLARPECRGRFRQHPLRHDFGATTVARTRLVQGTLWGERFGFGLSTVVIPADDQSPDLDQILLVPSFQLPASWERAIDVASEPVLIVGGAALITYIIADILSR